MNNSREYKNLLRTVYSSIIGSKLTPLELRNLAEELRRGQLPDELSFMLDQVYKRFASDNFDDVNIDAVIAAGRIIKRRKISRSTLSNILVSLGGEPGNAGNSAQALLRKFVSEMPPAKVRKLLEVLESSTEVDDFLTGISRDRK